MKINKASPVAASLQYTRNFANLEVGGLMTDKVSRNGRKQVIKNMTGLT